MKILIWILAIFPAMGKTHYKLFTVSWLASNFSFRTLSEASTLSIFWFYLSLYFPNIPWKDAPGKCQSKHSDEITQQQNFKKQKALFSDTCSEQRTYGHKKTGQDNLSFGKLIELLWIQGKKETMNLFLEALRRRPGLCSM